MKIKQGDTVKVKLMEIDDRGRLNFSMKALLDRPQKSTKSESKNS